jgi:hypothetical protein
VRISRTLISLQLHVPAELTRRLVFYRIDQLLGGGVRGEQLTELAGPSASGKTQVR